MVQKFVAILLATCIIGVWSAPQSNVPPKPEFTSKYQVSGNILLPYAELNEPFVAYYDGPNDRSRIDYYGDLMISLQKSSAQESDGASYKIAYDVDQTGAPQRVCFQVNGTSDEPVEAQSVFPDLSDFRFVKQEPCPQPISKKKTLLTSASLCERWELVNSFGEKNNTYEFWVKRSRTGVPTPIRYLMFGFDSLMGSHYDKYIIEYHSYQPDVVSDDVFNVTENYDCHGFPGPGNQMMHKITSNPMHEFIGTGSAVKHHPKIHAHYDEQFDNFKNRHNRRYTEVSEASQRRSILMNNLRYIESMNRKHTTFRLAVNHLADRTVDELRYLRGKKKTTVAMNNGGQPFPHSKDTIKNSTIPDQWDWRLIGAVTPVKDQAICGSCWSYGITGTCEGRLFLATGKLFRLSQQQLVDCSWNYGNNGCDGGEDFRGYQYIMHANGLAQEDDYGHYLGVDGKCHDTTTKKTFEMTGWVNVTSYDSDALQFAIFKEGPVTVAINVAKTLLYYSSGVYHDLACTGGIDDLDHQVLAVGYGEIYGHKYWLIKNSWSTYWGNDGYVLISRDDNMCGVTAMPSFPLVKV